MKKVYLFILIFLLGSGAGALGVSLYSKYNLVKVEESKNQNIASNWSKKPIQAPQFKSFYNDFFDDDFFGNQKSPFKQMEKMRKKMDQIFNEGFKDIHSDSPFDNWYKDRFGGSSGEINQSEDNDYVYYKIDLNGVDKESVQIDVSDGQVSLSGSVKKTQEDKNENSHAKSFFSQSFQRSFPVPTGVEEDKVTIDTADNQIVIKFPKEIISI